MALLTCSPGLGKELAFSWVSLDWFYGFGCERQLDREIENLLTYYILNDCLLHARPCCRWWWHGKEQKLENFLVCVCELLKLMHKVLWVCLKSDSNSFWRMKYFFSQLPSKRNYKMTLFILEEIPINQFYISPCLYF